MSQPMGTLSRLTLATALILSFAQQADAQQAPRSLSVTRDLEISGITNDLSPISSVSVSRQGWIAVGQRQDAGVRVFGPDGSERFRFGRNGTGPGEFRMLAGFSGWVGDTLWMTDGVLNRLTMITPAGKLLRATPYPAPNSAGTIIPSTAPRQGELYVVGVDSAGAVMFSSSLIGVTIPDVWKASKTVVQSTIWWQTRIQPTAYFLGFEPKIIAGCSEGAFSYYQIACPLALIAYAPTGDRFVIARPEAVTAKDGSFWLTVVGTRGDSLVHRLVRYSGTPIPRSFVDSSKAACRARESTAPRKAACNDVSHSPQLRYIHRVMLGLDRTIWLQLQPDVKGRHWLILSPAGDPIGKMTFPSNFFLRAANGTTAWGAETDADDVESVVRYRIGR